MAVPILLVHGAWHGAWAWDIMRRELDALGEPAVVVGHSYGGQVITEAAA